MITLKRIISRAIRKIHFQFCEKGRIRQSRSFLSLRQLKEAVGRQYFFVRKNSQEMAQQLIYYFQNNDWASAKKMLFIINFNQLDSWLLLRKIAKTINNVCNNLNLSKFSREDIESILTCLTLLKFQPKNIKVDQFKGRASDYDDSTPFLNQVQKHIRSLSIQKEEMHYFQLAKSLLHTNPLIFVQRRQQLEKKIIQKLRQITASKYLLNDLLMRGCVSHFWTESFIAELLKKDIPENYLKSIHFNDYVGIPNKIEKIKSNKMKTQNQFSNILEGFGYDFQSNVLINNYEVDFLIGNKMILEYNGHHHYIINSKKLISTAKDRWKQYILQKRNFGISTVPYSQWKNLKLFQQKREYLLQKVENDWLSFYKDRKSQQK